MNRQEQACPTCLQPIIVSELFRIDNIRIVEPSTVKCDVINKGLELAEPCKKITAHLRVVSHQGNARTSLPTCELCDARKKGLELAEPCKKITAHLRVVSHQGNACTSLPTCELVSDIGRKTRCSVKEIAQALTQSQYEISFQPTSRGRYQLHIKVEGEQHIKGSPITVNVKLPIKKLGNPIKTLGPVNAPQGIAFNQCNYDVIVVEYEGHRFSIFSQTGEMLQSFGLYGSSKGTFNNSDGHGLFDTPCGVAVDDDNNILVVDGKNHRIQKFTLDGEFITAVGKEGNSQLEFSFPVGIGIHPVTKRVYITENKNHRVQILNPDLTYVAHFGSYGNKSTQFNQPKDVAFDSNGNVYVADNENHRIQVFTNNGVFLREFGTRGKSIGQLEYPSGIAIDSDDVVYVTELHNCRVSIFSAEGDFKHSFGSKGSELGQMKHPRGIAVDKNGIVYVSDHGNKRVQLF